MLATSYTLSATTELEFAEAAERVRDELKAEGFGVLCEIDVQATLKEKLGVDGEPYVILGACNPPLAHQASRRSPTSARCCRATSSSTAARTRRTLRDRRRAHALDRRQDELAPVAAQVRRRLAASSNARRSA